MANFIILIDAVWVLFEKESVLIFQLISVMHCAIVSAHQLVLYSPPLCIVIRTTISKSTSENKTVWDVFPGLMGTGGTSFELSSTLLLGTLLSNSESPVLSVLLPLHSLEFICASATCSESLLVRIRLIFYCRCERLYRRF